MPFSEVPFEGYETNYLGGCHDPDLDSLVGSHFIATA